jgi:RHS repeat-associated protein
MMVCDSRIKYNNKQVTASHINEYYPFGLVNQQTSSTQFGSKPQNYKTTSKELFKEFNLEALDFGARMYSPQIGRWSLIDAKASKYVALSPYNYVANNPLKYIDPNGEELIIIHRNSQGTILSTAVYNNGKLFYKDGGAYKGDDAYIKRVADVFRNLEAMSDKTKEVVNALVNDAEMNEFSNYEPKESYRNAPGGDGSYYNRPDEKGSFTKFDIYSNSLFNNEALYSKEEKAGHEMKHRFNKLNGLKDRDKQKSKNGKTPYGEVDALNFQNFIRYMQGKEAKTTYDKLEVNPADLIDAQQYELLQRQEERKNNK